MNVLVGNQDLNLTRREADLAIRAASSPPEHLIGQKLFSLPWGPMPPELRDNHRMRLFREFIVERFKQDATLRAHAT